MTKEDMLFFIAMIISMVMSALHIFFLAGAAWAFGIGVWIGSKAEASS